MFPFNRKSNVKKGKKQGKGGKDGGRERDSGKHTENAV